jgi:Fic family protein
MDCYIQRKWCILEYRFLYSRFAMRREELTGKLREPYSEKRGCGIAHTAKPGYENIWFVVPPSPPMDIPDGLPVGTLGKANLILQSRSYWSKASPLDHLAAFLFARREAVSSSRMEGTWSTIDDVLTPGEALDDQEEKSETRAVRGYAAALEYGYKQVSQKGIDALGSDLICELHELVMSKDPDFLGIAGRVRTPGLPGDVVQIGGGGRIEDSIYNPAPPEHVRRCLDEVMTWLTDKTLIELGEAGMGMSLPVRMAIGHSHFEAVHPFPNGNGRIGRIIWSLQMVAAGILPLYLSGYVESCRDEYARALQEAQKQLSYGRMVKFICDAVITSSEEENISKTAISKLPEIWEQRGKFRSNSSSYKALGVVVLLPVLTTSLLSKELGVSFQAASTALSNLAKAGIVRERTGYARNRIFAAEEVIAILARPFGEDPEIALEGARHLLGSR